MMDDLARADAFARRQLERLSTEVVPFAGGVTYLDGDFPLRYDSNFLWVTDPGAAPVERWTAEADRILGARGYRHRKVLIGDPTVSERLAMGFIDHGYAVDRGVLMIQRADPEHDHDGAAVEEVGFDEVRPLIEETNRRQPWATDTETVRQLTDHPGKLAEVIGARFFMARVDGRPAGCCELYVDGDEAQVESVDTLEEYRGRGLASAFVLTAAAAAREAGATWIHLWADADDWPQHWYRRLGFREAARTSDFTRWGPGEEGGRPEAKSPGSV